MNDGWSEKALQDLEAVARQKALYDRIEALTARCAELEGKLNKASQVVGLLEAVFYHGGWRSETGQLLDRVSAIMSELGFVPYRDDRELEQMVAKFINDQLSGQRDLCLPPADGEHP